MHKKFKTFLKDTYKEGDIISSKEMVKYIEENKLRDSFGIIKDYNDIKNIAYSSDFWKLDYVNLSNFNWNSDKNFKNKSMSSHPIVLLNDGVYDVLDGKHRIGMYNDIGYDKVLMWIGNI